ncbi:Uma2 family endonuclease [Thermomonospora amylolytica]|uniref:Uma2 family endonuclease n=1 Tax=Thermomonospora amylolytica TaxID=1411117 RepID=UPI001300256D|nr:Uma2 family endonuclease [Thermomonospora amylolytica]
MSITTTNEHPVKLPDTAHAMWERGELHDFLHLPHDNFSVEIIGGKIVVSPAPRAGHGRVIRGIYNAFRDARVADPQFPWDCAPMLDLNLTEIGEGYCPDLMVMQAEILGVLEDEDERYARTDHVEMVVEVTSPSNASNDRRPAERGAPSKWTGYARAEIPYYLLVDRDPKGPLITLYSVPDPAAGAYLHSDTWEFGDTVTLEHFGLEIDTTGWAPWKD